MEILKASELSAKIEGNAIPKISEAESLAAQFILPDNAMRNWNAYESMVDNQHMESFPWLVDPQTNGGLLFTFAEESKEEIDNLFSERGLRYWTIGNTNRWDDSKKKRLHVI